MALVVSGVSTLIHLYSVSYMASDRGYTRFFAYLNFFVFSMLLLVLAGNFFFLIVGWAFVGAASYLLISFWYRRTTATRGGHQGVRHQRGRRRRPRARHLLHLQARPARSTSCGRSRWRRTSRSGNGDLVAGCLLLLVGAFAKSAQVPLHTWLPDAMEGPTPVSALIHAATMVTAGVYLIARMHPFFEQAPVAADVGAIIGCLTLLIAATIGLVVTDLKRVIAYSTMSQIGYMVMGVASFAYVAGLFHLMTHAFFKALLFMAAGSVIAAMAGEQNLDKMGGFKKAMPFTFGCDGDRRPRARRRAAVRRLLLQGRDPRATSPRATTGTSCWRSLGYVGAFMTAVYTWRMIFRAFYGPPVEPARELEHGHLYHAPEHTQPGDRRGRGHRRRLPRPRPPHRRARVEHEGRDERCSPSARSSPALLQIPHVTHVIDTTSSHPTFADSTYYEELEPSDGAHLGRHGRRRALLALGGIALAYALFVKDAERRRVTALRERLAGLHAVRAQVVLRRDHRRARSSGRSRCSAASRVTCSSASSSTACSIGGPSGAVRAGSAAVRAVQSGFLRYYAALLLVGVTALGLYFLIAAS